VSPLQAAIIALFHESDPSKPAKSCSLEYIKDKLGITAERVRQQCAYWVTNGVLKELQVQRSSTLSTSETQIVYLASKTLERDTSMADKETFPSGVKPQKADEVMD